MNIFSDEQSVFVGMSLHAIIDANKHLFPLS